LYNLCVQEKDILQLRSYHEEAFCYYRKVAEFDSSKTEAISGAYRTDSLLNLKNKPQTSPTAQIVKKTKTNEEIEALFQSGVSKFIAGEFKDALKIFKEVLKYNKDHTKAQEYLKRTEARLKVLEEK
jgi:tetratricopeptide (TPR) repeat protein